MAGKRFTHKSLNHIHRSARYLSLRGLTGWVLALFALWSVFITLGAGEYFYRSAVEAQSSSLNRVLEVSSREILQHTDALTTDLAHNLAQNSQLIEAFKRARDQNRPNALIKALNDPFITGFIGAGELELIKLRSYSLALKPVGRSSLGKPGFESTLPSALHRKLQGRQGPERYKSVSLLWQSRVGPSYSLVVPIGGLEISGYLEVIIDPTNNLLALSEKMGMPIALHSGDGEKTYHHPTEEIQQLLPVTYHLKADSGKPLYRIVGYENIANLRSEMRQTQFTTVALFLLLVAAALLLAHWLFHHFLLAPIDRLKEEINAIRDGASGQTVHAHGLKDIADLADAFNAMNNQVHQRTSELQRLSVMDPLTGIGNRRLFDQHLARDYRRAYRDQQPISLLLIDIDYFKRYNDSYGHQAGDECLQAVALALHNTAHRPADLAARYGGEEFAVVLPDTPYEGAERVARKIQAAIAHLHIRHMDSPISTHLTISIGGATLIPHDATRLDTLIQEADRALYDAKAAGRSRSRVVNLNNLRPIDTANTP